MAEKKKMTVAEILAAARAEKGGAAPAAPAESAASAPAPGASATPESDAADAPLPAERPSAPKPAAKPAASGGRPSVAEIMALARAKKADGASSVAEEQAAAKPAPKAPAAKPAAAKPAAATKPAASGGPAKASAPRDTASILAAARAGAKPGPVSKADAPAAVKTLLAESTRPSGKPDAPKGASAGQDAAAKPVATKTAALKTAPPMPTRPAKAAAKAADDEADRRGFLSMALGSFMALGFTSLSVTGGLFSLGLARFMFPNVLAEPPSRFKVGFKDGFPVGKVETKYVAQFGVWVVNSDIGGQQQIYALKTVCTHLGCTPNWLEAEQKFKCPCHGSGFYKDGVNFEGPAPRPLERYAIKIADDGQLEVDKSRAFQEELGQWNDPSSFVPV